MIKRDSIQRVLDTSRVEEVLSEFLSIRKRGSNFTARCPFHDEKTSSFSISPVRGIYKCFGCGKSGNSVSFLMDHESMTFIESIEYLAKKYNITLEQTERTQEEISQRSHRESLLILNEYATTQFQKNLNTEEGTRIARAYLKNRGYTDETIVKFRLGYSIDSWTDFSSQAKRDGYSEDLLVALGICKRNEQGQLRDFYKGRILFPIGNLNGKTIGFGARVLDTTTSTAKYLNSPENELYHKGSVLYGMHLAKKMIQQKDSCILVEGYTDVISLHQIGVEHVVSSSGTALSIEQVRMISRFTDNIYFLFDGDNAGINAVLRGLDIVLRYGMNLKVIILPTSHDPDSYIREYGADALKNYIDTQAIDVILYKLSRIDSIDIVKKAEQVQDIIKTIALIPDAIKRHFYIKEVAQRLDIEESILHRELKSHITPKDTPPVETKSIEEAIAPYISIDKQILIAEKQLEQSADTDLSITHKIQLLKLKKLINEREI